MILPVYCRKCGDGPFLTVMDGQKHQREKHPRRGLAARLEQISRDVAVLAAEVEQLEAERQLEKEVRR